MRLTDHYGELPSRGNMNALIRLCDVTCCSLSIRRALALAGCLAGRGKTGACAELPSPVCVLPDPHDCELPGAELHHCTPRHALRIPARFSAEQPHH